MLAKSCLLVADSCAGQWSAPYGYFFDGQCRYLKSRAASQKNDWYLIDSGLPYVRSNAIQLHCSIHYRILSADVS